jgi:glycosyltransferase involved in cell wall biosynthesis
MSAQEAAATRVPVIASDLVPFATEFLLGESLRPVAVPDSDPILVGAGAIVVPADSVAGFAKALVVLLTDSGLRQRLGETALQITVPAFGWDWLISRFLGDVASTLRGSHE